LKQAMTIFSAHTFLPYMTIFLCHDDCSWCRQRRKYRTMKAYRVSGAKAPRIRNLHTKRWRWLASFGLRKHHWIGSWVGPRAGLSLVSMRTSYKMYE
jgi:hypothetical protein